MENHSDILKVIPKIVQWDSIPYSAGLKCRCGRADIAYGGWGSMADRFIKPLMVGWCETSWGLMGVFECPECHGKFRCHCGGNEINCSLEEFASKLHVWAQVCENWNEIETQLKEQHENH